ncbi:hypothetical protein [Zavarzinella formosa]|uniref:hypothetical protein n=1 Tax=Zavarzinella formosa TaxID=360055 RepID=UPI0002D8765A|nr:hypothetical protein [Zavarzinella formosa]
MKIFQLLLGLCLFAIAGCGSNEPSLVPVEGKLTMGGKPVPHKSVRFTPEPGTPGLGAGGNTNAEGDFKLLTVRPGATTDHYGLYPGKYKVTVTEPFIPVSVESAPPSTGDGPAAAVGLPGSRPVKKLEAVPARYSQVETTPLTIEITQATTKIDLDLIKN